MRAQFATAAFTAGTVLVSERDVGGFVSNGVDSQPQTAAKVITATVERKNML